MERFVLGVDAGATKTLAAVASLEGVVRGQGRAGPGNFQVVGARAPREIDKAMQRALRDAQVQPHQLVAACYGVAGADRPADFSHIRSFLATINPTPHWRVENDATIALKAAVPAGIGVVVVCGTGYNCLAFDPTGNKVQVGGLGYVFGDFAGADQIGAECIRAASRAHDGRGPDTMLLDLLRGETGVEDPYDLVERFYPGTARPLHPAQLAPLAFAAAERGDSVARQLLEQIGRELALAIKVAIRRSALDRLPRIPVVLAGAVLQSDSGQAVLPQIRIEVQATYPQADPVVLDTQPVLGALMFALETAGMELAPARCERLRATWERRATPGLPPVHRGEGIKLVVVGGGSTYTPELIEGFVDTRERLALRELVLVDPDTQRLQAVGDLAQRMLARASREHVLKTTGDLAGALAGADYVIAQFRVGGMTARIWDERIPLELGCIGQETVGAGGFACALRTVPVALALAREMERYCPSAWLINFTNPSGLITEALYRHADIKVAGLCNVPIGFRKKLVGLGLAREEALRVEYKGLNHLGWFTGMTPTQILAQLLTDPWLTQMAEQLGIDRELIRAWGAIPNPYLRYYVHPDRVLAEMTQAPATRGEQVAELERELLDRYRDPSLDHKPIELEKRGGAFYSLAAVSLIAALEGTAPGEHVLSFPHEGVIEDLPADAVAELTCRVSKDRIEPAVTGHLPPGTRGLVQAVKEFEIMTIAAAVTGSPDMALLALSTHPLVPSLDVARRLLSRFREAHAAWLPPGLRP